jgi:hypothetical protein
MKDIHFGRTVAKAEDITKLNKPEVHCMSGCFECFECFDYKGT